MMRRLLTSFLFVVIGIVSVFGFRGTVSPRRPIMMFSDMDFQPRYRAQGPSRFFADGRAQRPVVTGTVAFGGRDYYSDAGRPTQDPDLLQEDAAFYRGKDNTGTWVAHAPVTDVDMSFLRRGRKQYTTYCSVCHRATGLGNGIMKEYGFAEIPSLVDKQKRQMPAGQIFHTIANGKGLMQPYRHQITPKDRWAVVLYVRALQISQSSRLDDVPEPYRSELLDE